MIPVPLKIIKLLVLELGPTVGGADSNRMYTGNSQLAADSEGSDDEGGDWEEVPPGLNVPGLSNEGLYTLHFRPVSSIKRVVAYTAEELLALGGGGSGRHSRQTDDETYVRLEVLLR